MARVERRVIPQPVEHEYVLTLSHAEALYLRERTGSQSGAPKEGHAIYNELQRAINDGRFL